MAYGVPVDKRSIDRAISILYIHDVYRDYLRSLMKFLIDIHEAGYCTIRFKMENLVMRRGYIKFFGLGFHQLTLDCRNNDFQCLYAIVHKIFERYPDRVLPPILRIGLNFCKTHVVDRMT